MLSRNPRSSPSPLSWLGLGKQPRGSISPFVIRQENLGRGNVGKTALEWALSQTLVSNFLPSGLQLDMANPMQVAEKIQMNRSLRRRLENDSLLPTLEATPIQYVLYQGEKKRILLQSHEVIGQILTNTTPSSPPEWQQRYREYVDRLCAADVLVALIPCPATGTSGAEMQRFHDDLKVTTGYLRAALGNRIEGRACSVVLALSKIDTAFRSPEEARQQLTEQMLRQTLAPLVNLVTMADPVRFAAIVPFSSFGFDNAVRKSEAVSRESPGPTFSAKPSHPTSSPAVPPPEGTNRVQRETTWEPELVEGEPEEAIWTVRRDALVVPFNVNTLMVWSLLHGLRVQDVDPDDEQTEGLVEVGRRLKQDLESLDGWVVALKGNRAT